MTKILIPIPNTPISLVRKDRDGNIILETSREWYRYFSLLQQAIGDTNLVIDNEIISYSSDTSQPVDPLAPFDLGGQESGEIAALQAHTDALNPQIPAPVELGRAFDVIRRDIPFPMPPIEFGSLQAAQNLSHRIVASGNVVLVAGTATVNTVHATSANEWSLTAKVVGGTQGILSVGTITANTSFVVNSSNAADTSTVSWAIFAPIKG